MTRTHITDHLPRVPKQTPRAMSLDLSEGSWRGPRIGTGHWLREQVEAWILEGRRSWWEKGVTRGLEGWGT